MWMKKSIPFVLFTAALAAVVAELPSPYAASAFATFRPVGHVAYQGAFQPGYQGGYHGGFQSGYQGGYRSKYQGGYDEGVPTPFSFQYEVKDPESGNEYGHHATSDGRSVQGEYQVLLPDGRRQIVKYTADDNGYNADVQYEGQARQYLTYSGQGQGAYTGLSGYTGSFSGFGTHRAAYSGYTG